MGFAAELKGFAEGFETGVDIVGKVRKSKTDWDKHRRPTQAEIDAQPGLEGGGGAIPEVIPTDQTTTGSTGKYRNAIASIESGGQKDPYRAQGPVTNRQGDRALGRYQIMASNVGPWSKQVLGRELTTDEFLANDALQDQIFDTIFGGYVQKFGERGAAQAWFGGPGSVGKDNRKDVLGTTIKGYGDKFMKALGQPAPKVASTQAAPAVTGPAAGMSPEEEETASVIPEGPEEQPVEVAEVSFDLPEVALPEITDWTEFAKRGNPVAYAARGGVVPKPVQSFQTGGAPVDPYNPSRAMTQPVGTGNKSTFVPRRVGQPSPTATLPRTGPTPSQQALIDARAKAAVVPAAAPAQQPINMSRLQEYDAMMAHLQANAQPRGGQPTGQRSGGDSGEDIYTPRSINPANMRRYNQFATPEAKQAFLAGTDPTDKYASMWLTNYRKNPGATWKPMRTNYAGGGIVTVDPEYFEAAIKRERSGGGDEQEIRDRAAKRINRQMRGVESSAIRVGKRGKEAVEKSRERSKTRRADTRTTPRTDPDKTSSVDRPILEDRATRFRRGDLPALEDRATRERRPPQPLDVLEDRATRDVSGDPSSERTGWRGRRVTQYQPSVEEDRATRQQPIPRVPPVVYPTGLEYGEPGEVVLSRPPRDPIITPDDRATREPVIPETAGGWTGRRVVQPPMPVEEDRATRQGEIPPVPQETVVRPPINDRGQVMQSGGGTLSPVTNAWFIERDGVLYQVDPKTMNFTPVPTVDPSAMYQHGGIIPEDVATPLGGRRPEQYAPPARNPAPRVQTGPGQNVSAVEPEPEHEDVRPTPKLRNHVAQALDGGIRFLTNHFGLKRQGAMPSPEDGQRSQDGIMRMAQGEGRATPDEIQGIDDKVDPDRRLDESDRHMSRLAKTTQWYLQMGRKEDAEAAAASLMMYGAHRFGQLGQLAATGYRKYQQGGNPEDLQKTIQYLEQAYKLIPDGGKLDVSLNPETQQLQVTRISPEGEEETREVTPEELGSLVSTVQNTSTYWNQIFRLADPEGARSQDTERRQEQRDIRTEERVARRDLQQEGWRQDREERTAIRTEKRDEEREKLRREEEERREERWLRQHPEIDWDAIAPLRAKLDAARVGLGTEDEPPEDPDAARAAYNDAASRLFDALSGMSKDPAKALEGMGLTPEDYTYVAAEVPPAKYPDAQRGRDRDGNPIWVVMRDGKPYQVAE